MSGKPKGNRLPKGGSSSQGQHNTSSSDQGPAQINPVPGATPSTPGGTQNLPFRPLDSRLPVERLIEKEQIFRFGGVPHRYIKAASTDVDFQFGRAPSTLGNSP